MKFVKADNRVLMLMLLIGAIGGTFAIVQGLDLDYDYKSPSVGAGSMLTGNVQVTQFGPDGSIIAYRQSDNHIVEQGMEIIMSQVFGGINATYPRFLELTGTHPVRYMQIGNGTATLYANDTNIAAPIPTGGDTCGRVLAGIINTTQDGSAHGYPAGCEGTNSCSAQMNVTATALFYGGAVSGAPGASFCATDVIQEAGIFDNSSSTVGPDGFNGGLMFARNTFGSVNLGSLDTLQLDWEFTFTDS